MQKTSSVSISAGRVIKQVFESNSDVEKQSQNNVKEKERRQKVHIRSNSYGMTPNMYPKVFSTKVHPMIDSRGKLNVKFFLKPSILRSPSNSQYHHQYPG